MREKGFRKDIEQLDLFLDNFSRRYNLRKEEVLALLKNKRESRITVPLSIFLTKDIAYLEAIVKYLKEYVQLKIPEISKLLKRKEGTLWATYYSANRKSKIIFNDYVITKLRRELNDKLENITGTKKKNFSEDEFVFDISVFSDRNNSVFQKIAFLLKNNHSLKNIQIARLLDTKPQAIWNALKNYSLAKEFPSENDKFEDEKQLYDRLEKRGGGNRPG